MAKNRNFSVIEYFNRKASQLVPKYRFSGNSKDDFKTWKRQLLKELKKLLGPTPEPCPLNAEIIWEIEQDNLIKRRVVFNSEKDMSVPALIYIPLEAMNKPTPAILCNHGHGKFAKDSVMGITSAFDKRRKEEIESVNYDYGLQMAKHGYITMAIDFRCFGERSDNTDPYTGDNSVPYPNRDICNVQFIRGSLMGVNLLALDIFDATRALDYLCGLDCVDENRIGCMGCSFGGTMTTWLSLLDSRIKATDIISYSCNFKNFAIANGNFCGSQYLPGLFQICDVADLQGLIAPRPLLAEIGVHDKCFLVDDALQCSKKVAKIFDAAGTSKKYEIDLFNGDHGFAGNKAFGFFDKYLRTTKNLTS